MKKFRSYHFYELGAALASLSEVKNGVSVGAVLGYLFAARFPLEKLLDQEILPVNISHRRGVTLLNNIDRITKKSTDDRLDWYDEVTLDSDVRGFTTVLSDEVGLANTYVVLSKRGYDISALVESGEVLFPAELPQKVPDSLKDLREAAKCLAFELPTAAAFHLHRANEAVLRRYWDVVSGGAARPKNGSLGSYLSELNRGSFGDDKVKASLNSLRDLHRNPVIHPEDSLQDFDEAVALLGAIQSTIVHMLKVIPLPQPDQTGQK
jgi:hypothetical protein